jgi:hypothetical protein
MYVVVVKAPDPPRAVAANLCEDGRRVRITWQPPASRREVAGYALYRQVGSGPLERLTPRAIPACEYVDASPAQSRVSYRVRSVEHSGLYGAWSGAAWTEGRRSGADVLDCYDVIGTNFMTPSERIIVDRRQVAVHAPVTGEYALWGRGRACADQETIRVSVDGKPAGNARIRDAEWHWCKLATCWLAAGDHVVELARDEQLPVRSGNLLSNPGFEEGLQGWSVDPTVTSLDDAQPRSGKRCLKLSGNLTEKRVIQTIRLPVRPERTYRMSFWIRGRFSKGRAHDAGNKRVGYIHSHVHPLPTGSTYYEHATEFDDGRWHQFHIWFHTESSRPGQAPIDEVVVQPFRCTWGEHVGTLWLDDVEFVDLGPRLRPAKLTALVLTNLREYQPQGLDGREAYAFPKTPLGTATGLRQTARDSDSITLAWTAARPGTRGYNIYLAPGADYPATKYFLRTTVWGRTSVTLNRLARAAQYTVKVAAINEDGAIGPAVSLRVETGD